MGKAFNMLIEKFIPKKLRTLITSITKFSESLVIVPDEQKIALKFEDKSLNNDHAALLKRYKANLSFPSSPLITENPCSKRLL